MTSYHTLNVEGTEVFYREGGTEGAPTILLLHGFPSSSAQYGRLMTLLEDSFHLVAPDYPGFGQSPPLAGTTTFDRLAQVIDAFTHAKRLTRFSAYVFDFGSPIGFRLATRDPGRIEAFIVQNANAYEVGLGPGMRALMPFWRDRAGNEEAMRTLLTLDVTRSQYTDGVPDVSAVNPDLWELDQRYLELPDRAAVMLDLFYDYQSNVAAYPAWQEYMRVNRPPLLIAWGQNDAFFPVAGARAYLTDVPDAELHLFDTGHFATATHSVEIAGLMRTFLEGIVGDQRTL